MQLLHILKISNVLQLDDLEEDEVRKIDKF